MSRLARICVYTLAGLFGYAEPRIVAALAAVYIVSEFLRDVKVTIR